MKLFGYPEVGRYGLGHGLLAWARCVVWCQKTGATMLAANWLKLRIGPYLRGERDRREYFKLFYSGAAAGFPTREFRLATSQKVLSVDGYFSDDIHALGAVERMAHGAAATVFVFTNALENNEKKHFQDVFGHSALLRDQLLAMTRPKYQPKGIATGKIAIHVRLGDFVSAAPDSSSLNNLRQPIDWYCSALDELRKKLGRQHQAVVFSDGSDSELATLLAMENVTRAPRQESVTDLLSIAEAAVLIASGSGFSLWGAFLGQVPSLFQPGRKIVPFHDRRDLENDWEEGMELGDSFMIAVSERLVGC